MRPLLPIVLALATLALTACAQAECNDHSDCPANHTCSTSQGLLFGAPICIANTHADLPDAGSPDTGPSEPDTGTATPDAGGNQEPSPDAGPGDTGPDPDDAGDDAGIEEPLWPPAPTTGWTEVASGNAHTCAINTGSLWCWGFGRDGRLGIDDTNDHYVPRPVGLDTDLEPGWTTLSAGAHHTCALRNDDSLWCWGWNPFGQLGLGHTISRATPHQATTLAIVAWTAVSAGWDHTCAIQEDTSLWCWGRGQDGQLGLGTTADHSTPQPVAVGTSLATGWTAISAGNGYTCGLRTGGTLWCWGEGSGGRLGLGGSQSHDSPQQVGGSSGWLEVATGSAHTCARRDNDALWCWGVGTLGRLGLGDSQSVNTPRQVGLGTSLDSGWATASLGDAHSCALRDDASLWCWGRGANGRTGLGDVTDFDTPQQIAEDDDPLQTSWTRVSASLDHTCAVHADQTLYCWGFGGYGALGLDDTSSQLTPQQVAP